jgi:hypothetical protein
LTAAAAGRWLADSAGSGVELAVPSTSRGQNTPWWSASTTSETGSRVDQ